MNIFENLLPHPPSLDDILAHAKKNADSHYPALKNRLDDCGWPEIQPIRWEILQCLLFGLHQAAITLTNHYLESLLKYALVVFHADREQSNPDDPLVKQLEAEFAEPMGKFGGANLYQTINAAHSAGLLSKEQRDHLHFVRERFRNAYGHADKGKTFGETTVPTTGVKLAESGIRTDPVVNALASRSLVGQGLMQAVLAEANAQDYFELIDDLALEITGKLFPSLVDQLDQLSG